MFLDIVGVITTSKLSILSTFQGGGCFSPPPCQVGLKAGPILPSIWVNYLAMATIHPTFLY